MSRSVRMSLQWNKLSYKILKVRGHCDLTQRIFDYNSHICTGSCVEEHNGRPPCPVGMNGSVVWLAVKGGAVWLPRVPAVAPGLTEGGWGLHHPCVTIRAPTSTKGKQQEEAGGIHEA